jgi:hypothetical protein
MNSLESSGSDFESPDIIQFIQERGISPEHFGALKRLSQTPKNVIIAHFHNFFNLNRENSATELKRCAELTEDKQLKKYYEDFLEIVTNYDWTAALNFERLLERA